MLRIFRASKLIQERKYKTVFLYNLSFSILQMKEENTSGQSFLTQELPHFGKDFSIGTPLNNKILTSRSQASIVNYSLNLHNHHFLALLLPIISYTSFLITVSLVTF